MLQLLLIDFRSPNRKIHLLKCYQANKIKELNLKYKYELFDNSHTWHCRWESCSVVLHDTIDSARSIATHLDSHLVSISEAPFEISCAWSSCRTVGSNLSDLCSHLKNEHQLYTSSTLPVRAEFCFECSFWGTSECEWRMHMVYHLQNPSMVCGPIVFQGLLVAAGRCPYCMQHGLYTQIETQCGFLEHVKRHLSEQRLLEGHGELTCPHPSCEGNYTENDLRAHLQSVHRIKGLFGR